MKVGTFDELTTIRLKKVGELESLFAFCVVSIHFLEVVNAI